MRCVGAQHIECPFAGSSAETIALLVVGGVLLLLAGINEVYTNRSPIIPPRLFRVNVFVSFLSINILNTFFFQTRTTAIILISNLLHAIAFFGGKYPSCPEVSRMQTDCGHISGAYYLPLYFQVLGSSATGAGVR